MTKGNRTAGSKRKGGRRGIYPGGTAWATIAVPAAVAAMLARRGLTLRAYAEGLVRDDTEHLVPWPSEAGPGGGTPQAENPLPPPGE